MKNYSKEFARLSRLSGACVFFLLSFEVKPLRVVLTNELIRRGASEYKLPYLIVGGCAGGGRKAKVKAEDSIV